MKVREVIFFYAGKTLYQPFQGIFHGDLDFFDLHKKSLEMADKVFCPNTKNNFTNVIAGGALVVLCP